MEREKWLAIMEKINAFTIKITDLIDTSSIKQKKKNWQAAEITFKIQSIEKKVFHVHTYIKCHHSKYRVTNLNLLQLKTIEEKASS